MSGSEEKYYITHQANCTLVSNMVYLCQISLPVKNFYHRWIPLSLECRIKIVQRGNFSIRTIPQTSLQNLPALNLMSV